jgi:transcription antitermination factor NusA-like protein
MTAFSAEYDRLRSMIDGMTLSTGEAIQSGYEALEKDANFVTLMLFGKTKAGKSTTMEALLGGDGSTLGRGRQHTTTDVKAYYYPKQPGPSHPSSPCLRIVDTPGIEGFEGDELARMAEDYVERSDHILFLLTDDKASSDELERFGLIRTQGKGITVLLNVKSTDEDLDLLVEAPHLLFRQEELDGHVRRISGYLRDHFAIAACEILPFHARAAWLARNGMEGTPGAPPKTALAQGSRIALIEQRILRFIMEEATLARIRAPRDLLNGYLWSLKDALRPFAGGFRKLNGDFRELTTRLDRGVEKSRRRVVDLYPLLKARFQSANDGIPGMLDEVIAAHGQGRMLSNRWVKLLKDEGVSDSVSWFTEAGNRIFQEEISEDVKVAVFDIQFSRVEDLGEDLDAYGKAQEKAKKNKYGRAALRTGAGAAASGLAWWAVANWWNPTGWAAAAAAVGVAAIGMAGEYAARQVTDEMARSNASDLLKRRNRIIGTLKDRLWADYRESRERCSQWLDQTKDLYLDTTHDAVQPIQDASAQLWQATVDALRAFDAIARELDNQLVTAIVPLIIPEFSKGELVLEKVVRQPGFATRILVSAGRPGINVLGACLGLRGARIRLLAAALGGEKVAFVDQADTMEEKILQALGLTRVPLKQVVMRNVGSSVEAHVRLSGTSTSQAIGPNGANVRLVHQLLGVKVTIGVDR